MKAGTRSVLAILPLALQGLAAFSAIKAISFFLPVVVEFLKAHEGKFPVPRPTRLLVAHPMAASAILFGLFAVSVLTYFVTRTKVKEEADQLAVQSAVYGVIWHLGLIFFSGLLMAAALPFFAFNSQ